MGEQGPERGPASRRHPLALLSLLATAPDQMLSRTKLIGLLWPEVIEATGRNRLTSTLYHLRGRVGKEAIVSVGDMLRLETHAVDCDLWRFREALRRGDERTAVRIYRGPFLDGFHLDGAAEFEHLVDRERQRLRHSYWQALETLAERAEADGDHSAAAPWWRERLTPDPYSTSIALRLVEALRAAGSPAEALSVAEAHALHLRRELDVPPPTELAAVLEKLRAVPARAAARPRFIAVLPFDVVGDQSGQAIGDGMHIGLVARLSQIAGLGVIARTTMLQYRGSGKSIQEIGHELGVDWVLEGDVQAVPEEFRLNVRLVQARSDRQVWAEEYRGNAAGADLFEFQADTARGIIACLEVVLSPAEQEQVGRRPTSDVEAFRLWAEGNMQLERRSPEAMQRAVECFQRSLGLDRQYVHAWIGLANSLGLLHAYGFSSSDVLVDAEAAIDTALELDPLSAEAHAALGRLLGQRNEARQAQRELELAVELNPGYAEAHNWLTVGHHALGNREPAFVSARRALELNPLSPEVIYNFASAHLINGQHESALLELRRLRELVPSYESARLLEGITLYELGQYGDAEALLCDLEIPWAGAGPRAVRALALVALADRGAARRVLSSMDRSRSPFDVGLVLTALGEREAALDALGEVDFNGLDFASSFWPTIALRYLFGDVWGILKEEPRFGELLRRMDGSWGR